MIISDSDIAPQGAGVPPNWTAHYTWTTHYREKYWIIFERFFHAFNGLKMHTSLLIKVRKFIQRIDSWNCVLNFCRVHEILYVFRHVPNNQSQGELAQCESALLGCERYRVRSPERSPRVRTGFDPQTLLNFRNSLTEIFSYLKKNFT